MSDKLRLDKNKRVTIKNDLIRKPSVIDLNIPGETDNKIPPKPVTALQLKLIRQLIASVDTVDDARKTYTCNVIDFANYIGMSKKIYSQLPDVVAELTKIQTVFTEKNANGDITIKRINWISMSEFTPKTGGLKLKLTEDIIPYIVQLKDCYTSYQIESIISLTRAADIKLYEYLISLLSLIEEINKEGRPYDVYVNDLRIYLSLENKYTQDRDFVRMIKDAVKTLNARTELQIRCIPEKINKEYVLHFYVSQKAERSGEQISPAVVDQKQRDNYIYCLSQYYIDTVKRNVGKKMKEKLGKCYDEFIRAGIVRQAFYDTALKDSAGLIEKSTEAYARRLIDIYVADPSYLSLENQQMFEYDRVTKIEHDSFGSDESARIQYKRLISSDFGLMSCNNETGDIEVYVFAIRKFAEQKCKFKPIDYKFYQFILQCFQDHIDIRVILNALWKTRFQSDENNDGFSRFNPYAYATTIAKNDIEKEKNTFDLYIEQMNLEWCRRDML